MIDSSTKRIEINFQKLLQIMEMLSLQRPKYARNDN
jgi:hypothetical protein